MATKKTTKRAPKPISKRIPKPGPFDAQKDILLPKVGNLEDLFAKVEVRPTMDPGKVHTVERFKMGSLESTGYCSVSVVDSGKHFDSLTIRPSELLASTLASTMLKIDYDLIHFEIIVYADRSSRVYAKYGQILGSRLVAAFDAKATRAFFRNLSKLYSYPTLPRASVRVRVRKAS